MLVIDTGVLLAAADNRDRAHTVCVDLVETTSDTLITTALVVAERLGVTRIATLDRRHVSAIKPVHCPAFALVP